MIGTITNTVLFTNSTLYLVTSGVFSATYGIGMTLNYIPALLMPVIFYIIKGLF